MPRRGQNKTRKIAVEDNVQVMEIDPSTLEVSMKLERSEKARKRYLSNKLFTYEIYAETSKAAHKVFQQRGASSIRELSFPHNLQFKHD